MIHYQSVFNTCINSARELNAATEASKAPSIPPKKLIDIFCFIFSLKEVSCLFFTLSFYLRFMPSYVYGLDVSKFVQKIPKGRMSNVFNDSLMFEFTCNWKKKSVNFEDCLFAKFKFVFSCILKFFRNSNFVGEQNCDNRYVCSLLTVFVTSGANPINDI